jgi:hypothetical protein
MSAKIILIGALLAFSGMANSQEANFQVTRADTSLQALLTRWAAQAGRIVASDLPIQDVALLDVYKNRSFDQINARLDHVPFEEALKLIFQQQFVLVSDQEIQAYLDDHVFRLCVSRRDVVVIPFSQENCSPVRQAKR